jgi:hypothetical protein
LEKLTRDERAEEVQSSRNYRYGQWFAIAILHDF